MTVLQRLRPFGATPPMLGVGQKAVHRECQHSDILGVAHGAATAMPTDEKPCLIQVRFLSLKAIVQVTNALAKLVKQPNRAQNGSGDFVRFNIPVHKNSILL